MAIQIPDERVFYYECSAGRFRLVCFLPFAELKHLAAKGAIDKKALRDFPDGLDLDCTPPDFAEFEKSYGYRHPHGAEQLRQAFLALFSSTKNWQKFRGSGFLAASELEDRLEPVEAALRGTAAAAQAAARTRAPAAPRDRRALTRRRALLQKKVRRALEKLKVRGIDPRKSLRQQVFKSFKMSKGKPAPEFYAKLQRPRS